MFRNLRALYLRFKTSKNYTNDLDAILSTTDPEAPLYDRLSWLVDLMQWVRYKSYLIDYKEIEDIQTPVVRLRFLLKLLNRHPLWKKAVAQTLRSIVIDTRDVELFATTGMAEEQGFWSEFSTRLSAKIMPARPLTEGGVPLFTALFPGKSDWEWFSEMPPDLMDQLVELFLFEKPDSQSFAPVLGDIEEAILILVSQVRSIGMMAPIRKRVDVKVKDSPFFELTFEMRTLLADIEMHRSKEFKDRLQKIKSIIKKCYAVFAQVYHHLDDYGVSLKVVYLMELGQSKLKRVTDLLELLENDKPESRKLIYFVGELIKENQQKQSLSSLFEQNTRLISRKIIERNADKGEHYITRNRQELRAMFRKAGGGGALMSFAVLFKVVLSLLRLPEFLQGFIYSLNYSFVFVAIQIQGFTLATKQPAMTATALASKMEAMKRGQNVQALVDEISKLIRTQVVGILGNVGVVIPCIVAMDLVFYFIFGAHMIRNEESARYLMNSSHLISFAGLYGAFTGVLLWISSIIGGYADNWFALNRMRETLCYNRRLNYVVGKVSSEKLAYFFERNVAGLASNISLAFFLGMIPQVMIFLGIYLDVRHVTLAAGNLALGGAYFGLEVFYLWDFWLSCVGLFVIGFFNVAVSFALAFWVAVRSRSVESDERFEIYKALLIQFRKNPWAFLFSTSGDSKSKES